MNGQHASGSAASKTIASHNKFQKIILLVFIPVAWLAATSGRVDAYFHADFKKRPIIRIIPKTDTMATSASHVLIWSDSDESLNQSNAGTAGKTPASGNRIHAEYLPITEIVTRQSDRYIPSEFSIENLLYANLKLERLMNEYENLRKRSKSVLKGLDVPYIHAASDYKRMMASSGTSITPELDRVSGQTNLIAGPIMAAAPRQPDQTNPKASKKAIQFGFANRLNIKRTPINYSSGAKYKIGYGIHNQPDNPPAPPPDASTATNNYQYGVNADDQVPWAIRATRALRDYLYNNKIEAFIYFLLIYGAIHMVLASRK